MVAEQIAFGLMAFMIIVSAFFVVTTRRAAPTMITARITKVMSSGRVADWNISAAGLS